jgi:hypothetical protein
MMRGDGPIDQNAAQRSQPSQSPLLIGASKPAVFNDICRENCR